MRLATPLLLLAFTSAAFAQAPVPPGKDGYAYPPGGPAGTTVAVTLGGTDWTPDTRFFVHDPRVKLIVNVIADVDSAPDAAAGRTEVRLM